MSLSALGGPGLVSQLHCFRVVCLSSELQFSHLSNGREDSVVTSCQHGPQGSSPLGSHTLAQSLTTATRAASATIGHQ